MFRAKIGCNPQPPSSFQAFPAKEGETFVKIDVKTFYAYLGKGLIPYVRIQSNVRFVDRNL